MKNSTVVLTALAISVSISTPSRAVGVGNYSDDGPVDLQSAGAIAFGPDGVLFVGDFKGAKVVALNTGDVEPGDQTVRDIPELSRKIAALLGTTKDQILINDMAVNPSSQRAYFSVSRGRGPDALPVIVRTLGRGQLEALALDNIPYMSASLVNPVEEDPSGQSRRLRRQNAITDLAYKNGVVLVAGLSNEEFSSKLRSIPYPFDDAERITSVEMYHGSHGRYETNSPVRTFMPYEINGQNVILAAYTCTPLVVFQVSEMSEKTKVMGKTIAELGARNRPLDMIAYKKGGSDYILMTNTRRGVMKLAANDLGQYVSIDSPIEDVAGVPYETLEELDGVEQLAMLDGQHALILRSDDNQSGLEILALP